MRSTYFILFFLILSSCSSDDSFNIDLSGEWQFRMDPEDEGIDEKWFSQQLTETVKLPGSMTINRKGNPVGYNTKWTANVWQKFEEGKQWYEDDRYKPYLTKNEFLFPFWLISDLYYTGAAWYQKELEIPADWENKVVELYLERCHWTTQVWLDDKLLGSQNSLGTAHRYEFPKSISPGKHKITICVDNRVKDIEVGNDAHSVSDNTQSNWNGIIGQLKIIGKDAVLIDEVQIYPDVEKKLVRVKANIKNTTGKKQNITLRFQANSIYTDSPQKIESKVAHFVIDSSVNTVEVQYPIGDDVRLWDEFDPNLYELTVDLQAGSFADSHKETFGMRDFHVEGKSFINNGRPIFLRGTLECAIFPKTGYPPTDIESWERIINICKAHGLNHIRFHSWCPPKAAFDAADKLGFYYQVECSAWASVGDDKPIDQWIYDESERMVSAYGNHPSFCLMAYGNEPSGKNHIEYLRDFVTYWKGKDSRRVYTTAAGWPLIPENDYHCTANGTRIQGWGEELNSVINGQPPRSDYNFAETIKNLKAPMVSHEIGQWCVYPNLKEVSKYDGVLKPKNFEIFKRSLEAHDMIGLADSFLLASGKLQALCYKADIEAALRTPGFGGFQLLDLHDFPGQGTALVGVLDPFWEEKGYITPAEFSQFCNETVPLALFKKRIFTSDEDIKADIEIAHYGPKELQSVKASWKILDSYKQIIKKGTFDPVDLNWGNNIKLGTISENILVDNASKFRLEVDVAGFVNGWDIWVYPSILPETNEKILIVSKLDKEAISALNQGKNVLLSIEKGSIKEGVGIGFSSIFWNTAWTNGQKPHTLGLLCDPEHLALELFPTEYHSNWQWWDAMSHSEAILLDSLPVELKPIVRVIDDWVTNRRLALLFEAKVGNGKLLISGIDLQSELETRPEARQLLYSLKNYMAGGDFDPKVSVETKAIRELFD